MQAGGPRDGDIHNIFNGTAEIVVQFRDIYGDMHIHRASPPKSPVETAAAALAEAVFRQWREEAKVWEVGGDRPTLAVHWKPRGRQFLRSGLDLSVTAPTDVRPDELAVDFMALQPRRMVILGDPGAGKTSLAVLLTLELLRGALEERADTERPALVPVLFTLTSWNPHREEFGDWLVRRLAEDYPGLPRINGRHPARELWSTSRSTVLPVLDGLDEMPPDHRTTAVKSLNRALYGEMPLVLTSRTAEFDAAAHEVALRGAAVVEAQPVPVKEVVDYLSRSYAPQGQLGRWQPLFTHLREHPRGPVASALSTPLMIWLCRTAYATPASEPGSLTSRAQFPSRLAVEEHLLDQFVPAVFTDDLPSGDRLEPPRRWPPDRAHRYLRALASQLQSKDSTELAWWRLHRTPLGWTLALPLLAVLGSVVSEAAVLLGVAVHRSMGGRGFVFADGLGGIGVATALSEGALLGLALRAVLSTWYGELRLREPRRRASLLRPVAALRSAAQVTTRWRAIGSCSIALFIAGASMVLTSLQNSSIPLLAVAGGGTLLAIAVAIVFTAPAGVGEATSPTSLLRAEHHAVLLTACVIGPLLGAVCASCYRPQSVVVVLAEVVLGWLGAVSLLLLISPWSGWLLAKVSLALTRQAPWMLLRFLRDAHRQGVLRQFGGTYQFRSARLQQRLARDVPPGRVARFQFGLGGRPRLAPEAITFTSDAGVAFRLRVRRLSLGPLVASLPLVGVLTVRAAVLQGANSPGLIWIPAAVILGFAALLSGISWLRPRAVLDLRINRDRIECSVRKKYGVRYEWSTVEEVAFRRTRRRGRQTGLYGIHVRLVSGTEVPAKYPRSDNSWYVVCVLGLRRRPPLEIEEALREYAAERWRAPVLSEVSARPRPPIRLDAHQDNFARWENELRGPE